MTSKSGKTAGPRGGVRVNERTVRQWHWSARGRLLSRPVRCRREEWYLARARLAEGRVRERASVLVRFLRGTQVVSQRCLRLVRPTGDPRADELLGWIETHEQATHLQLVLPDTVLMRDLEQLVLHNVSERDPKCHPLANVPRWETYRPPFPIQRVVLPASLGRLAMHVERSEVEVLDSSISRRGLSRAAQGAACVIDPRWVRALDLTLRDVERMAAGSWVIVDLDTMARLVRAAKVAEAGTTAHQSRHGLMSARVEYGDVPTRGFALQDVLPYGCFDDTGGFTVRALLSNRGWRRYADAVGFATLLSCETPWPQKQGDVLSAVRAVAGGELIATDLPWLVAGRHGRLVAPLVAVRLLQAHLGEAVADHVQYWNRWENGDVVVRDISDLARRYEPLLAVRWASERADVAHLGLCIAPPGMPAARHVLFRTGRSDSVGVHDGVPPEPMMIFMKWLAREARERTPWARRHLGDTIVTWQFDTHDGLKYAANFDSAGPIMECRPEIVHLRMGRAAHEPLLAALEGGGEVVALGGDEGLFGDRSLCFQDDLVARLRAVLERGCQQEARPAERIARDVG